MSVCQLVISQGMRKIDILNRMRYTVGEQCYRETILERKQTAFEIQSINVKLGYSYLAIKMEFKTEQNKFLAGITVKQTRFTLQWRHNQCHGVSNHRCLDCLFNRLLSRRSKKTPKLRVTGLCEFPSQRASNTENVSIWWRQHDFHRARQPVSLRLLLRIHEPTKSYARPATVSRHSVVSFFLNCCGMAHIDRIISYSLQDSYACPTRKTI